MARGSFTDRVMARVAEEPTPSPGRVFVRSLGRFAIRDALAALAAAWRLTFEPASPVATSARASAAALFLSVIIVVGVGGAFVAGGALSLLGPDGAAPQGPIPAAAATESPTPTATPSPSPTPTATPSATQRARTDSEDRTDRETPEPEDRKQEQKEKRETPEPEEQERDERDEKDERDERDEKDEREEDD